MYFNMHYRILHIHLHLRHLSAMGSFSEDELQTGMEQCGLDWSSEEVEIVDSMNEGSVKFGEISPGVSEASRRESLTFSLEPQLLRAAPLQVVLSGWCKHWKGLRVESGEELFELSQPVQSIDVFLSHDWETSRFTMDETSGDATGFQFPCCCRGLLTGEHSCWCGTSFGGCCAARKLVVRIPFPCYWVYLLVNRASGKESEVFVDIGWSSWTSCAYIRRMTKWRRLAFLALEPLCNNRTNCDRLMVGSAIFQSFATHL